MTKKREHHLGQDYTFEELLGCLADDESEEMDYAPWTSPVEGGNSYLPVIDDYRVVASYLTVSSDVSLAPHQESDLHVLDPVKLEPLTDHPDSCLYSDPPYNVTHKYPTLSEGSCNPALGIACGILDVEPGELGLPNSYIDELLANANNAYKSDTDSGVISDYDSSSFDEIESSEIDTILDNIDINHYIEDMKTHFDPNCAKRCYTDSNCFVPLDGALKDLAVKRFEDSRIPIKKRRRVQEHCTYHKTYDVTPNPPLHTSHVVHTHDNTVHTSSVTPHRTQHFSSSSESDVTDYKPILDPPRKKPGRKPGQCSKGYHLWEFMRDLLLNTDTCPRDVMWVDQSAGIFRICNSDRVAQLWGDRKKNKKLMTYEKLSRALRFSRTAGYFGDLPKNAGYPRKLCFKFGPKTPLGRNALLHDIKLENLS